MSRNILDGKSSWKGTDLERREYNPPEESVFDSRLISRLLEHYIDGRDNLGLNPWNPEEFNSEVQRLKSMIQETRDKIKPQLFLDSIIFMLKDEPDRYLVYTRAEYLNALVQALYDLGCGSEFAINLDCWSRSEFVIKNDNYIGHCLQAEPNKPLTLNLYGNFYSCGLDARYCNFIVNGSGKLEYCGTSAEYCNFTLHQKVGWCGGDAKYSRFILYEKIEECGQEAQHCMFDLMPGAGIEIYYAPLSKNQRRRMNERGEWERFG